MFTVTCQIDGLNYVADVSQQKSLAITLLPNGEQPSHFGAPACTSITLESDGFIGDTQRGGSCNVNQLSIVAHCNGTHTESISHIVNESIAVYQAIPQSLFSAVLISLMPIQASSVSDVYVPHFDAENLVITRAMLTEKLTSFSDQQLIGLAIRTLPNLPTKKSAIYAQDNYPPYLTNCAMQYLLERNVQHLMVDFPSVDKMYDEGHLSNHRIFWNVAERSNQLKQDSNIHRTITEMIFVEDDIDDGLYLCNLQVPQIDTDAVPSQPILLPLSLLPRNTQ